MVFKYSKIFSIFDFNSRWMQSLGRRRLSTPWFLILTLWLLKQVIIIECYKSRKIIQISFCSLGLSRQILRLVLSWSLLGVEIYINSYGFYLILIIFRLFLIKFWYYMFTIRQFHFVQKGNEDQIRMKEIIIQFFILQDLFSGLVCCSITKLINFFYDSFISTNAYSFSFYCSSRYQIIQSFDHTYSSTISNSKS